MIPTFDPRPYLKDLARGEHGARSLTREQARTLFAAVFAGEVADVALGALLVALRVKGETVEELAGMLDALAPHVQPMKLPPRRAMPVVLPTYNGSRKMPNLVPLLALALAREGVPVLLHGAAQEPQRVDSFAILSLLGHAPVASVAEAESRLDERLVAPVPLAVLSEPLARLIDVRLAVGVRNCGHTIAKLLLPREVPGAAACRLIAVTHPDFMRLLRDMLAGTPANVFLMRGVEGEPVVRLHAPQPVEQVAPDGSTVTHLMGDGEKDLELPGRDAAATAQWTRGILDGRSRMPAALARQVSLIAEHCKAAGAAARPALKLVR
ncbi:MAG TPA: DNA-binding protein YbiB [Usitatibacter sp.]|nr:DNA-binding protein YbiB [Usitatibacter sp.]